MKKFKIILRQILLILKGSKSYPATPLKTWVYHWKNYQCEYRQIKTLIKYLKA